MKFLPKIIIVFFLSTVLLSCSKEKESSSDKYPESGTIQEALNFLKSQEKIQEAYIHKNGDIKVVINEKALTFKINGLTIKTYDSFGNLIVESKFQKNENEYSLLSFNTFKTDYSDNSNRTLDNPDHEGQDFCECYKNDVNEFCDGLIGCVALLHPLVQAVIITHCVIEVGTTDCDEDEDE